MLAKPRFVFDTSAVISAALLKQSISRRAFDKALGEGELLVSAETIDELSSAKRRELPSLRSLTPPPFQTCPEPEPCPEPFDCAQDKLPKAQAKGQ